MIDYSVDHIYSQMIMGPEGKNLLSALSAFVAAAIHVPAEAHREKSKVFQQFFKYMF